MKTYEEFKQEDGYLSNIIRELHWLEGKVNGLIKNIEKTRRLNRAEFENGQEEVFRILSEEVEKEKSEIRNMKETVDKMGAVAAEYKNKLEGDNDRTGKAGDH